MPPQPKHPSARARRNRHATATELVIRDPNEVEIPELPTHYTVINGERVEGEWHPEAVATWYEVWSSPMVAEFLEADSGGIRALLLLEQQMWDRFERGRGIAEIAAEISRVRKSFGLAPMGRRSLQWTIAETANTISKMQKRGSLPYKSAPEIEAPQVEVLFETTAQEIPTLPAGEVEELLGALE